MSTSKHSDALDVLVPPALDGERVDRTVCFLTGVSRSVATELIEQGHVRLDGHVEVRRSAPVHSGSRLKVAQPAEQPGVLVADPSVSFEVVHQDADIIVVDKPWHLVVHPGAGRRVGTLANGLIARYPELMDLGTEGRGDPERPGIVHRLDRGTSGLLVVARSSRALEALAAQMAAHSAQRRYTALVYGLLEHDRGVIDAPVGRSNRRPTQMTVSSSGREARTSYEVIARYEDPFASSLIVASLETGRTHQVRVHLAAIGHGVVGDDKYHQGPPKRVLPRGRFFLHACELVFDHPSDGRPVRFVSELPEELRDVLRGAP